jgi:probable blue pigment (indigoidine) exporter
MLPRRQPRVNPAARRYPRARFHGSLRETPERGGSNSASRSHQRELESARRVSTVGVVPPATVRLPGLMPAVIAALSFSATDILLKVAYASGMDVLTLASLRSVLAAVFFWGWLRIVRPVRWHTARERTIALGLGVLFALSVVGLLEAISLLPVSIAVLAYFIYPLLTGIAAALTGVERLGARALLTATVAFLGLALMLGHGLSELSVFGLACAFGAALCRVASLLVTRAYLATTDARVTTWYSMVASAMMFVAASLTAWVWNVPHSAWGWAAFLGVTITSTLSTLLIYISTNTVGPFRTALALNLEPLVTLIASMALLEEVLAPVQMLGAAMMIAALSGFQFARGR